MNLFQSALNKKNSSRPPVWFMRQAGRYHAHYQNLKTRHSFIDLCKIPEVSAEAAMGPIQDFDFDAAILFSDLLFPLEAMGMGLTYEVGPKLSFHLRSKEQLSLLTGGAQLIDKLQFQADCMAKLKSRLPTSKGLIGFVGGPLTLYCYAVEGSHAGSFESARAGFTDGRFHSFCEKLLPLLAKNMAIQANAGADTVAILDTCGGEFEPALYREFAVPALRALVSEFKKLCPQTPVVYYSKKTGPTHWQTLEGLSIDALGIDWNHDIAHVLTQWGDRYAIQGNIDPMWLFLEPSELEAKLRHVFGKVKALPASARKGWICGLGHGVLPKTPESNVRLFLKLQREIFE